MNYFKFWYLIRVNILYERSSIELHRMAQGSHTKNKLRVNRRGDFGIQKNGRYSMHILKLLQSQMDFIQEAWTLRQVSPLFSMPLPFYSAKTEIVTVSSSCTFILQC